MAQCSSPFCLGLGPEWSTYSQQETTTVASEVKVDTLNTVALSDPHPSSKRFNSFLTTDEAEQNCGWLRTQEHGKSHKVDVTKFNEWREVQNHTFPTDQVPSDLLTRADIESATLCKWLSHFVVETRNGKGEECTPATISQLLASIPRHMHNHNPDTPNFMDKKNTTFRGLHGNTG